MNKFLNRLSEVRISHNRFDQVYHAALSTLQHWGLLPAIVAQVGSVASSQKEVRELFRMAQLREFEPAGIHKPKAKSNVLGVSIVDSTHAAGLELRG